METFEAHYESMRATIARCMPGADMALIDRAVEYADTKHLRQKRKDGSPYIIHPLAVAEIVAEMGLDIFSDVGLLQAQRQHKYLSITLTPGNQKTDLNTSATMQVLQRVKES